MIHSVTNLLSYMYYTFVIVIAFVNFMGYQYSPSLWDYTPFLHIHLHLHCTYSFAHTTKINGLANDQIYVSSKPPYKLQAYCINVFARSDAVDTIYFITLFCAASIFKSG